MNINYVDTLVTSICENLITSSKKFDMFYDKYIPKNDHAAALDFETDLSDALHAEQRAACTEALKAAFELILGVPIMS